MLMAFYAPFYAPCICEHNGQPFSPSAIVSDTRRTHAFGVPTAQPRNAVTYTKGFSVPFPMCELEFLNKCLNQPPIRHIAKSKHRYSFYYRLYIEIVTDIIKSRQTQ